MEESVDEEKVNISEWTSETQFIVALLSWTIGLLNIFHTPQIFYKCGFLHGIAIYIPLMMIIGIPLTFMELAISQFSSTSSAKSWNLCPLFRGIGYSKIIMTFIFQIYYNVLNSYVLFYAVSSFTTSIKWEKCDSSWANSSCYDFGENKTLKNGTEQQSSIEQFWYNRVLALYEPSNKLERPHWEFVGYLCIIMVFIFLINCKGTRSLGKVLPYIMTVSSIEVIILLFVTTITPGSYKGFKHLFRLNFDTDNLLPWKKDSLILRAFQDSLYSMGLGLGGLSSLGAQNSFRKPVHAYAIVGNLVNAGTSFIFTVILLNFYGILSYHTNISMDQITKSKNRFSNNVFTVVPGAISCLPGLTQIWVFLFYTSIFLKGLSSSSLMASTILQVIYEFRPNSMKKSVIWSFICSTLVCASGFMLHTNLGTIINTYLNEIMYTTLLPLINTIQLIAMLYIYGLIKFIDDLQFMLGFRPSAFWQLGLVASSFLLPTFTIFSIIQFFQEQNSDLVIIFERCVLSLALFWIPFMIMVRLIRKGIRKNLLRPSEDWGPHDNILKKSRRMFTDQNLTAEYIYEKNLLKNKLKKYDENYGNYR